MSDKKEERRQKEKETEETARYTSSVKAEDPDLAEWIMQQWNGEYLDLLDIAAVYNRGKVFGNVVDREPFAASAPIDMERAVELCNRFVGAAVRDCTRVIRKPQNYYVRAHHTKRGGEPIDNFPLYIQPRTTAMTLRDPGGGVGALTGDDDEEGLAADKLSLTYVSRLIEAGQFDKTHYAAVFGDLLMSSREEKRELRGYINDLMLMHKSTYAELMTSMRAREEALSAAEDRYASRELTKLKVELLKDGVRTGRNLLTSLFGKSLSGGEGDGSGGGNGDSGNNGNGQKSEERLLLDNFINDCKSAGITEKLFGVWKKNDKNEAELVAPGVFLPDQWVLLMHVWQGRLPAAALDDLDPESGRPLAVTMKQIAAASAIMSEGVSSSLMLLFNCRKRKRAEAAEAKETAAAAAAAAAKPNGSPTPTPVPNKENDDV
jgi:hypothetical protein